MTRHDLLLERVHAVDPVGGREVEAWWDGPAPGRLLERIAAEPAGPQPGQRATPRVRRAVWVVAAVLAGSAGLAGAAAASGLLGGPAPDPVKAHLAQQDTGLPADLRNDPDLSHAHAVAVTDSAVLYLADLADGGYCIELASPGDRPRGASCVAASDLAGLPLDVTAPIPDGDSSPLLVGGRANDDRITRVEVRYPDGTTSTAAFGLDRSWLVELPATERGAALTDGVLVRGLDASGDVVTAVRVPPLRDDDPLGTAHDEDQPLVVTTTSDGGDLRLVLAVHGRVNLTGAVRLQLRLPDGSRLAVPVAPDGTFRLTLPADRRAAFATSPGSLVALRGGEVVASQPVSSVAGWRSANGTP